jgi:hypothetical protein
VAAFPAEEGNKWYAAHKNPQLGIQDISLFEIMAYVK